MFIASCCVHQPPSLVSAVLNKGITLVSRGPLRLVPLIQPQYSPDTPEGSKAVPKMSYPSCGHGVLPPNPPAVSFLCPSLRFSSVAGMLEMPELKKVTELRSRLRAVSEAGMGGCKSRAGGPWSSGAAVRTLS